MHEGGKGAKLVARGDLLDGGDEARGDLGLGEQGEVGAPPARMDEGDAVRVDREARVGGRDVVRDDQGEPLGGETLTDHDGATLTNNIGLRGLYLDAVVDGCVDIDYNARTLRFGLFLDERKAQAVENGNTTYPYVCFIPECGTGWIQSPWNFVPKPVNASKNYTWLWFTVSEDLKTLNYDQPNMQYLPGTSSGANLIIGITCAVCKNATPAADDIFGTYKVIYQANPNKVLTNGGFTLKKK